MRDHRKLHAFQLTNQLVLATYKHTSKFPQQEMYALTTQMRRAAVSVPANIVEGCARQTTKEYVNFLNIAFGSLRELGYYFELAYQLHYLDKISFDDLFAQYTKCCKVLSGLIKSLQD